MTFRFLDGNENDNDNIILKRTNTTWHNYSYNFTSFRLYRHGNKVGDVRDRHRKNTLEMNLRKNARQLGKAILEA